MKFEVTMETKFPKWRIAIEDSSNPYLSVVVKNTKYDQSVLFALV